MCVGRCKWRNAERESGILDAEERALMLRRGSMTRKSHVIDAEDSSIDAEDSSIDAEDSSIDAEA